MPVLIYMKSLIDRMRARARAIDGKERHVADMLASSVEYARLREEFNQKTGRYAGVPKTLDAKRKREAAVLLTFLLEYKQLSVRRISIGEAPDFRFSVGRKRIGLELTEAFATPPAPLAAGAGGGNALRRKEAREDAIVERAKELYRERGGAALRVHVQFAELGPATMRTDAAADELARLVSLNVGKREVTFDLASAPNLGPDWLRSVRFSTRPRHLRDVPRWEAVHGGAVHDAEECLPTVIQQKEAKLVEYRRAGCDEYWLLIFVKGTATSSFVELQNRYSIFRSAFHNTFLFSPTQDEGKRLIKLKTVGSKQCR